VITGFNTDIEFDGVTYHVQTEDKGLAKPIILSLVYDRGTILAAKRLPYDDLVDRGFDENELAARLRRQHKLICAAIQAGRIDDLRKLGSKDVGVAVVEGPGKSGKNGRKAITTPKTEVSEGVLAALDSEDVLSIPKPVDLPVMSPKNTRTADFEAAEFKEIVLPEDAVKIVSELVGKERPTHDNLLLEILGSDTFIGGDKRAVMVMLCRGSGRKVISGAQVMVKLLGSAFRPIIFHSTTDQNGIANVSVEVPHFNSGRAVLLVRATTGREQIELRRAVRQG
jgi:hypothetical protein